MTLFKSLTRGAGLVLCVFAFAGTALAGDNGNGNGNGNPPATPPGQEKKAEPAPAPTAAPAPDPQAAAPAQEQKAAKQEAKAEKKSVPKPAAQTATKPATKPAKAAAAAKAEKPAKTSGSYKNTSQGFDLEHAKAMSHKHTICHATGSESNPFVRITPSVSGVFHGHMDHQGDEDIVPPFNYKGTWYSQNWDAAGQAIFNAGCALPAQRQATVQPVAQATDVCPNIAGMQTTVPTGLVKDSSGNCVAPATPASTDVCPNIAGMQTTVPTGLVKDSSGNCVAPATPASTDVCPNIEGMQTAVPTGLIRNAEGHCVVPVASAAAVSGRASAPAGGVAGAVSPARVGKESAGKEKVAKAKAATPAGGVLGAVASAPKAVARTATTSTLPFTGVPLWIAALIGGALLATGLALRRSTT
jgi:hypothetical protein